MPGRNKKVVCDETGGVVFCILHSARVKSAFYEMRFLISIPKIPLFRGERGWERAGKGAASARGATVADFVTRHESGN